MCTELMNHCNTMHLMKRLESALIRYRVWLKGLFLPWNAQYPEICGTPRAVTQRRPLARRLRNERCNVIIVEQIIQVAVRVQYDESLPCHVQADVSKHPYRACICQASPLLQRSSPHHPSPSHNILQHPSPFHTLARYHVQLLLQLTYSATSNIVVTFSEIPCPL